MEEIVFLEHIVSREGVKPNPSKIKVVQEWESPKNMIEIKSLLGLAGYYRRFVKDFSTVTRTLASLLKNNTIFQWNEACQRSFERLTNALTTSPILTLPTGSGDYVVYTDASRQGLGCVLM